MEYMKLDYTGHTPDNLVSEKISVVGNSSMFILLACGDFFLEELVLTLVTPSGSLLPLQLNTDYSVGGLNVEATLKAGKEIYRFIRLNPQVASTQLQVDYHALGDKWNTQKVYEGFNQLLVGSKIPFSKVKNVPATLPVVPHLQQINNTFGWKDVAEGPIQLIRDAISSLPISKENLPVIEQLQVFRDAIADCNRTFNKLVRSHIDDNSPCHLELDSQPRNFKKLVGLSSVANISPTTKCESGAMATAESVTYALNPDNQVKPVDIGHASNLNNPHQVNKTQLGLSRLENFGMLFS